jgi:hypothetical protein
MIVILDKDRQFQELQISSFNQDPCTMWGRLSNEAYCMNYITPDVTTLRKANMVVMRVENDLFTKMFSSVEKTCQEIQCPIVVDIEGDYNGFRNWENMAHLVARDFFAKLKAKIIIRDARILPSVRRIYENTFMMASIFQVQKIKNFSRKIKKQKIIFIPYPTWIKGDRNGTLSVILAEAILKKHPRYTGIMIGGNTNDTTFLNQLRIEKILVVQYLDYIDYLTLLAQSQLCVNLDTIPGFGKIGVETAATKTFHLGTGFCGVTGFLWKNVSRNYIEYDQLFELGDRFLSKPKDFEQDIEAAYQKVDELDVAVGETKLKKILGVEKL